jgi:predicted O-linked N-acetylglucosamine transferase (SPINDLY family)
MRGLVAELSRQEFTVTVLSVGKYDDPIARFFKERADRFLEVPRHLPSARRQIADLHLDVLIYTDIGLDPNTYTLAFSRLAPVQCGTVGHPVTSGLDTIDYYVSTQDWDTAQAAEHYTESLVRLKTPPLHYYRPKVPVPLKERKHFGLAEEDHVYGCLQSLFKFHPEFDAILGEILRLDPRGILLLTSGKFPGWDKQLRERFAATIPDVADRIRFLPGLPYEDYLNLLMLCDAQLDPIHFGGGTTSYQAFAVGSPIVTWPSALLRGRFTFGMYQEMGILDCVAQSAQEYVRIAVRLGTDCAFRDAMRQKISAANGVLFENNAGIRELEQFLHKAVEKSRGQ